QYRAVAARHQNVASSLTGHESMDQEQVDILLVDDQPAKLLAYEVILKELGENLGAGSPGIHPQERSCRDSGGRLHAGARRLRARGNDPRTSALPEDGDDFHLRDSGFRPRSAARL